MKKFETLKPVCYSRFYCKGIQCRTTCCGDWRIQISEDERKKMIEVIGVSEELFSQLPNECQTKTLRYEINLSEAGKCPFLSGEKLCSLQQKYGHDILPETCKVFPRAYHRYLDKIEQGLSLGCEKTLELLFEEKDGLRFINKEEMIDEDWKASSYINEKIISEYPELKYYYDIQSLYLGMLQAQDIPIEDRLIFLGMAFSRIDLLAKKGQSMKIPSYINQFINEMEKEQEIGTVNELSKIHLAALYSNLELIQVFADISNESFCHLINKLIKNIDFKHTVSVNNSSDTEQWSNFEISIEAYQQYRERFKVFTKNKEYFLENMVIAFMLSKNIPFFKPELGVWKNYMYLVWMYSILKLTLTVTLEESSTVEDMIDTCTILFRTLGHSSSVIDIVLESLEKNQSNTAAHMAILLKSC